MFRHSPIAAIAIGIISLIAVSGPAGAHVTLQQTAANVGTTYKAVLGVPHGCNGKPTTSVRVSIPEGIIAVKPMPKPGWQLTTTRGAYSRAYRFYHGVELSEGVKEIVWSGGSLMDEHYDEFVVSVFVADSLAGGTRLAFPVIQSCDGEELRWVEVAAPGQDPHKLKQPAPLLHLHAASTASQHDKSFAHGMLTIVSPWTRATPPGATVAAGYMKIFNGGNEPDTLIAISSELATTVELHESSENGGVMRMRRLEQGIEIKPGAEVELKPKGLHAMLTGLRAPIRQGAPIKAVLRFARAGDVAIEFEVAPLGAQSAAGGHH